MVLVPVKVNGQPFTFILDSGGASPGLLLDKKVAHELKLARKGEVRSFGAGERNQVVVPLVHGIDVEFAGRHWFAATAGVTDFSAISRYLRTHIDGLLGTTVFSEAVIAIDYCRQEVQVIEPSAPFVAPPKAIIVGITQLGGLYASHAAIQFSPEHEVSGMFLLDTGAGPIAMAITRDQARRLPAGKNSTRRDELPAAGGMFRALLVPAQSVTIGDSTFLDVMVHVSENTAGGMAHGEYKGIIGGEFLRRFVAIFDVPHQRLILARAEPCG
jgi:predicted aspartyl protease